MSTAISAPFDTIASTLRPYQREAITATLHALIAGDSPVLAHPTGSGKSLLLGALALMLPGRVLLVSHRMELLEQDGAKMTLFDADASVGFYSAGLGRRDTDHKVIIGGVQSIYRRMDLLQQAGNFAYILCDECHLNPFPSDQKSMYAQVYNACPNAQRLGVSATPYRLSGGLIYGDKDCWFDTLAHEVSMSELTPEYLAPLVGILSAHEVDVSHVRTQQGEYVLSDLSQAASEESVIEGALEDILTYGAKRQHWLLFGVDVAHTTLLTRKLRERGIPTGMLLGTTPTEERKATLAGFQSGKLQALTNCLVATVGFDLPAVDLIALLRPTKSRGLCIQMLGRGSRQTEGKTDCLILDFSGNLERFVPLDGLPTITKSPARQAADDTRESAEKAERERKIKHRTRASDVDPMARHVKVGETMTYQVLDITYKVVRSKKQGVEMLLASYECAGRVPRTLAHFVLLEHDGWGREKAAQWCARRGLRVATARQTLPQAWQAPRPQAIVVQEHTQYPRIVLEQFDEEKTV